MSTYLITGASRGIGLELTRQLLALPPTTVRLVFALSRSGPNPALSSLLTEHRDRLIHITASVTDTASVRAAASEVVAHLEKQGKGLDVLVNNAGTQNWNEGGIAKLDEADLLSVFDLNVVGVQRVTAAFMPLLEKGGEKKVINMYVLLRLRFGELLGWLILVIYLSSSTVGSIDWAPKFAAAKVESYKVSKAALNMLNQQWAMQYADAGFTFLLVSPGVSHVIRPSFPTHASDQASTWEHREHFDEDGYVLIVLPVVAANRSGWTSRRSGC